MIQISEKTKQDIQEKFTKYEIARILGARALQLAMNAPILLKLSKDDIEKVNFDPLKIAELEFYAGVLPITVKRPLPPKREEKIIPKEKAREAVEEEKQKKEIEEEKRKAEEEKKKVEEAKRKAEGEKAKTEEKIIKEVQGSEIMELAKPQDETEEEPAAEAEV